MIPGNHDECMASDEIIQAPGLAQPGTYNMLPEPARVIDVDVFTRYITREKIVGLETRQPRDLRFTTLRIFWMSPGNGVGVSRQWSESTWKNVHWFFGCEHELVERELTETERDQVGLFIHEYVCEHCGYGIEVDSSG